MTRPLLQLSLGLSLALLPAVGAGAEQIASRAALDSILSGSEEYLEDFEEVSLHSGTHLPLPNPFDQNAWPDLLPGASYASGGDLAMWAWFLFGDDSNILEASTDLTIRFEEPQLAVGFDVVGVSNMHYVLTFFHGDIVIDMWEIDTVSPAVFFAGWQNSIGITSVHIDTTASSIIQVDNVGWGVVVANSCPADIDEDGTVGFTDLVNLLANWGGCACPADVNGDDEVDFADLVIVLAAWGPCPV